MNPRQFQWGAGLLKNNKGLQKIILFSLEMKIEA